jgi:hypothetical protein
MRYKLAEELTKDKIFTCLEERETRVTAKTERLMRYKLAD